MLSISSPYQAPNVHTSSLPLTQTPIYDEDEDEDEDDENMSVWPIWAVGVLSGEQYMHLSMEPPLS
jgi:hypothetical protein